MRYHIGTSGWNYDHWKKSFYPERISRKEWFSHYCRVFDIVEVNYSFYNWPKEATLQQWHEQSPASFRFTLKAPRLITHMRKLKNVEEDIARLYYLGGLLKRKLGCYLFQLPPNYTLTDKNYQKLESFVRLLDGRKRNVIEFRYADWWNQKTYQLLQDNKVIFCNVGGLGMPGDIVAPDKAVYFRWHGREYNTDYSYKKLKQYAKAIRKLDCDEVYGYFNNDEQGFAPKNAAKLKELIKDGTA